MKNALPSPSGGQRLLAQVAVGVIAFTAIAVGVVVGSILFVAMLAVGAVLLVAGLFRGLRLKATGMFRDDGRRNVRVRRPDTGSI